LWKRRLEDRKNHTTVSAPAATWIRRSSLDSDTELLPEPHRQPVGPRKLDSISTTSGKDAKLFPYAAGNQSDHRTTRDIVLLVMQYQDSQPANSNSLQGSTDCGNIPLLLILLYNYDNYDI